METGEFWRQFFLHGLRFCWKEGKIRKLGKPASDYCDDGVVKRPAKVFWRTSDLSTNSSQKEKTDLSTPNCEEFKIFIFSPHFVRLFLSHYYMASFLFELLAQKRTTFINSPWRRWWNCFSSWYLCWINEVEKSWSPFQVCYSFDGMYFCSYVGCRSTCQETLRQ